MDMSSEGTYLQDSCESEANASDTQHSLEYMLELIVS